MLNRYQIFQSASIDPSHTPRATVHPYNHYTGTHNMETSTVTRGPLRRGGFFHEHKQSVYVGPDGGESEVSGLHVFRSWFSVRRVVPPV